MLGNIRPKILNEAVKLEFFSKNKTVFSFGYYGYHYYIILRGSAYCLLPNSKDKPEPQPQTQVQTQNSP